VRQGQPENAKSIGHADAQMNGEGGGGHQPPVKTSLRNNSFAAKYSAARGDGRVNFAGHVGSHRPLEASNSRANSSRSAPIAVRESITKK
jgi:hypothetical protein